MCGVADPLERVREAPITGGTSLFVEGAYGSGKSQCLAARIRALRTAGVPGHAILVLVAQREWRSLYIRALAAGGAVTPGPAHSAEFLTYYGLASRSVRLFWPAVAGPAGFVHPARPPVFLTYETAQYLMGRTVVPRLERGYFEGLSLRPQRILSQLLDNLNKAAINGYPVEEVGTRLRCAWGGDAARAAHLEQAQECALAFRAECLRQGLVDSSLAVQLFDQHLLPRPSFWAHLSGRYRHLLVDQLEETVPVAQDLIRRLLTCCDSACLFLDPRGGYRVFMGIDARGAVELADACTERLHLPAPQPPGPVLLGRALERHLGGEAGAAGAAEGGMGALAGRIACRYRADMISRVASEVVRLVERGVAAGEIAVVAPHADGVLRHLLGEALSRAAIPFTASRRFTALREEPLARLALTLASLAHPGWQPRPHPWDVSEALAFLCPLDPVRAALATRHLYDRGSGALRGAQGLGAQEAERLGGRAVEVMAAVSSWLAAAADASAAQPIDHFLRRLFGEIVSRPDLDPDQAAAYARLVTSADWFRQAAPAMGLSAGEVGQRFVAMVWEGVVAAAPAEGEQDDRGGGDSVLLVAPVYTYLLQPRRARFQFWLDVGSMRWWEPPHQPLTNPHVLSRSWPEGAPWSEAVDYDTRNRALRRLVLGLCRRCTEGVYVCSSEVEAAGEPQDSPLLRAFDRVRSGR